MLFNYIKPELRVILTDAQSFICLSPQDLSTQDLGVVDWSDIVQEVEE